MRLRGRACRISCAVCAVIISTCLINTSWLITRDHPYQNVYFNLLTGNMENAKDKFEMDYWGLSYRQALEYIVENDTREEITVCVANPPGEVNALVLYPRDRNRLIFSKDLKQSDYFLSNYRWHKKEYDFGKEVYSIKVGGAKIMTVRRMSS